MAEQEAQNSIVKFVDVLPGNFRRRLYFTGRVDNSIFWQ